MIAYDDYSNDYLHPLPLDDSLFAESPWYVLLGDPAGEKAPL